MQYTHIFKVAPKNRGTQFPIDMLRYDHAVPVREIDSTLITETFMGRMEMDDPIELQHRGAVAKWQPTAGRWESFGWQVLVMETRRLK